jgi:UDP-GlcNAc:undecaprenyl-phosphate/decaprenyl-phosphate GlcNAc-1-phosphate transferase
MSQLVTFFLIALAISLVLTPICRAVGQHFGVVAKPSRDRWHTRPTALFGGVAIAITVLVLAVWIGPDPRLWQLIACGALIATFGFVDDLMSLKASTKLIAQITVASLLLFFGYRLQWTESMIGDALLTLFWIVGITNAFNLLDNMDGLCAGTALIGGAFLLIVFVTDGAAASPSALYLAALLGATTGFLVYNFHPASIFMGDTGSLFLGLNVAALTLLPDPATIGRSGLLSVVAVPVLPLLIPIFDTTLVTALRLLSGRRPSQGGRDHMSHRLVAVGLSERRAVTTLWALAVAGGLISLLHHREKGWGLIAALTFVLAMIIFAVYLARIRVYDEGDLKALEGQAFTPLVANFMYKRRVAEVLLDLCLIPLAYYSAYRLRFEGSLFAANYQFFLQSLPVVIAAQLLALFVVGGYRGTWRHFGMMDAVTFGKGVVLGTVAAQIVILYLYRFESYSRAVFVIDAALLMLLLSGSRASFRLVAEFILRRTSLGRRCVIYGTGGASLGTIREAFGADVTLKIVGFIDDDPLHRRMRVSGYSVLGDYAQLLGMIERRDVDCVVLNTPVVSVERLQELEQRCGAHEIDLLRLHVHLKPLSAAAS